MQRYPTCFCQQLHSQDGLPENIKSQLLVLGAPIKWVINTWFSLFCFGHSHFPIIHFPSLVWERVKKALAFSCALAEAAVQGADFHVTLRPRVSQRNPGNLNTVWGVNRHELISHPGNKNEGPSCLRQGLSHELCVFSLFISFTVAYII